MDGGGLDGNNEVMIVERIAEELIDENRAVK
jgi:hypothetical protein